MIANSFIPSTFSPSLLRSSSSATPLSPLSPFHLSLLPLPRLSSSLLTLASCVYTKLCIINMPSVADLPPPAAPAPVPYINPLKQSMLVAGATPELSEVDQTYRANCKCSFELYGGVQRGELFGDSRQRPPLPFRSPRRTPRARSEGALAQRDARLRWNAQHGVYPPSLGLQDVARGHDARRGRHHYRRSRASRAAHDQPGGQEGALHDRHDSCCLAASSPWRYALSTTSFLPQLAHLRSSPSQSGLSLIAIPSLPCASSSRDLAATLRLEDGR